MASIEVDPTVLQNPDTEDYESSGYDTSTASLTTSINQYIYENGRRYHQYYGEDKNLQPTDEVEQNRLDLHHEIFLLLLDRQLHKAPISKTPHRILDVGTGTGIWAIDMADKYPTAEIIGTDLSPIQSNWVPPNCRFEVDDAELDWTYHPNSFDFVHVRNLAQSISNWPKFLLQAYKCTMPGGYIELAELCGTIGCDDGSLSASNGLSRYYEFLSAALEKMGRPPLLTGETLRENLEKAGFVDIKVEAYKQPFAPWPKDKTLKQVGTMMLANSETGWHAYGMAPFTRILGMSYEEADRICSGAVKSTKNKNEHTYTCYYVVHGRKPG